MKRIMVDSSVWRIPLGNPKNQTTMTETIWHSILKFAEESKLALLYNQIIENEVLSHKSKHGHTVTKSENALSDMKRFGKKIISVSKIADDLEKIIETIKGKLSDKQILRDALANNCNGIIAFNKRHFESKQLSSLGFDVIDLKDFEEPFKAAGLLRKLKSEGL